MKHIHMHLGDQTPAVVDKKENGHRNGKHVNKYEKAITTTQELRQFLCEAMVRVINKELTVDAANSIAYLAQQVHNTITAEVRVANARARLLEKNGKDEDVKVLDL